MDPKGLRQATALYEEWSRLDRRGGGGAPLSTHMTRRTTLSIEVEVEVDGDYEPYVPARISGPPEDCYPAEGGIFAITDIHLLDKAGKRTGEKISLPPSLEDRLAEDIYAEIEADTE